MTNLPPKPPRPSASASPPTKGHSVPDFVGVPPEHVSPPVVKAKENPNEEQRVVSAMPGVTDSKMFFEFFIFNPDDTIPKGVLIEVLRAARLTLAPATFEKLSPEAKRQFLRMDRTGAIHPYRAERKS